jgi:hypothetical protein
MKKILVLLLFMGSTNVFAGVWSGNDLVKWFKDEGYAGIREAYIAGVVDTVGYTEGYNKYICILEGTTTTQIVQLTYNYMQKHPEKWTVQGSYFVVMALFEAYPCKK